VKRERGEREREREDRDGVDSEVLKFFSNSESHDLFVIPILNNDFHHLFGSCPDSVARRFFQVFQDEKRERKEREHIVY